MKKYLAEMVGTMVLVLMGCGVAVSLGCDPINNIPAVVGTAFAFGLSVVAMAYTIGGISGCHINPAITLGCFLSGRMSGKDCGMYIIFQVIGAFIGSLLLYILTENVPGLEGTGANDLQANVSVLGGLLAEIIFTCVFVLVVLGATAKTNGATNNFAGLASVAHPRSPRMYPLHWYICQPRPLFGSCHLPGWNGSYQPLDFHRRSVRWWCLCSWYLETD